MSFVIVLEWTWWVRSIVGTAYPTKMWLWTMLGLDRRPNWLEVTDAARHSWLIVLRLSFQCSDKGYRDALWIDIFVGRKTEGLEGK